MKAKIVSDIGETLTTIPLDPHTFKTGSVGFVGREKISDNGKRYQVQVQVVEIGSKRKKA
ncbi:MAG: hypothetical protein JRD89_10500 [Deltaproteobacteria bacterium]|nr:hypothetical protein [Deltaproteobacteria bacterium]